MHLDCSCIDLDRVFPAAPSFERLAQPGILKSIEKEMTDHENISALPGIYRIHSIACLRAGHFRRLTGHSKSGPGTEDYPANCQKRSRGVEGRHAEHRPR